MLILNWIVSAIVIGIVAFIVPGVEVGIIGALLAALVIGLINSTIRPVISALTLPVNVVTLGIFSLIVNTLLVMFAAWIVPGFSIQGFWYGLLFVIVLSFVNIIFGTDRNQPVKVQ